MKIYTKTGDAGETGLSGGSRTPKICARIHAIGDVDELNAILGLARQGVGSELDEELHRIQGWLFELGAELASIPGGKRAYASLDVETGVLERSIDLQTELNDPLRNFVLPGGSEAAARLHLARCVCRRAERSVLELHEESNQRPEVLAFINRLSDWLFVAARTANRLEGVDDVPWHPAKASGE